VRTAGGVGGKRHLAGTEQVTRRGFVEGGQAA
jgi:hypothetical protein